MALSEGTTVHDLLGRDGYEVRSWEEGGEWCGEARHRVDPGVVFEVTGATEREVFAALRQAVDYDTIDFFYHWMERMGYRWDRVVPTDRGFQVEYVRINDPSGRTFCARPHVRRIVGQGPSQHLAHEDALRQMECNSAQHLIGLTPAVI